MDSLAVGRITSKIYPEFSNARRILGLHCMGEGAGSHRGKLSLAQNNIIHVGKSLDNAPVGNPKQQAFWEISHFY